jgi:catechol 2,3-dioxygenase-like lactoylglutathione lyase family enzyme
MSGVVAGAHLHVGAALAAEEEIAMKMFKELNHVSITVTDVAKAREFYTGVLGFEEIPRPAFNFPGIWYGLGNGLSLHIILNDELVRPAVERETILARYGHFALWTEDADATAKHIEELGLPCRDVVSGPTGLRQVFVKDPDGNMVEFIGPTASKEAVRRMESPATA